MKKIDIRSVTIGACLTCLVLVLLSSKSEDNNKIEINYTPYGPGIYNSQTKTLYFYKFITANKITTEPQMIYKVNEDGSSLTLVK